MIGIETKWKTGWLTFAFMCKHTCACKYTWRRTTQSTIKVCSHNQLYLHYNVYISPLLQFKGQYKTNTLPLLDLHQCYDSEFFRTSVTRFHTQGLSKLSISVLRWCYLSHMCSFTAAIFSRKHFMNSIAKTMGHCVKTK